MPEGPWWPFLLLCSSGRQWVVSEAALGPHFAFIVLFYWFLSCASLMLCFPHAECLFLLLSVVASSSCIVFVVLSFSLSVFLRRFCFNLLESLVFCSYSHFSALYLA